MEKKGKCCFCGKEYTRYGNDIRPLISTLGNRCCDKCNAFIVIPNRMRLWNAEYYFVLKDKETGKYLDELGEVVDASFCADYVPKFKDYETAISFVYERNLNDTYKIVRMSVREDD